ncbi:MAG: LmeA family phospholipid-binding protein [Armatimonadetes bacterium]|jgi:hypothetical protein|nr:LmeA family phospholipid-binding protein [Armatimonadota bacterium]MDI9602999.1 LmeA family phospholipid-binding protein [Acidobacteriota bacterium]NLN91252.1 LmeA family phospholipid-binding protein [candidate division WS1 bacterium]
MQHGYPQPTGYEYASSAQRPRSRRSCCCAGCAGLLFLSALCFFGGVVSFALRPPQRSPEVRQRRDDVLRLWDSPPPATPPAEVEALKDRMRQTVERLDALPAQSGPRSFEVAITEDEVNTALAADPRIRAELEQRGVRSVSILFEGGRAMVDGVVDIGGVAAPVTADAVPTVNSDGTIHVAIENARAGMFPLPAALLDQVRTKFEEILRKQDPERGRIQSISLQDGVLTLRGEVTGELPSEAELRALGR